MLSGLADGLARSGQSIDRLFDATSTINKADQAAIQNLLTIAKLKAADSALPEIQRLLAFKLLIQVRSPETRLLISLYFSQEESPAMQMTAAAGLADLGDVELARQLIERWGTFKISARRELIDSLLHRVELAEVFIVALERGLVDLTEVGISAREELVRIPNKELQSRAAAIFQSLENSDRDAVVSKYESVLDLKGNSKNGALLFARDCLGCHQMKGVGARVGPELSAVASRPKAALLVDILNPSKEMSPDFLNFVVVTKNGKVTSGLLVSDTINAVKLRRSQGIDETLLRTEIEELRPFNKSLMPDGLEQKLSAQEIADLLEFLQRPVPLPTVFSR